MRSQEREGKRKPKNRRARPAAETTSLRVPSGDKRSSAIADGASWAANWPGAHHVCAILALCILGLLAFSNTYQAGFILDNKGLLLDPRIRDVTPENLALISQHSYWWPTGEAGLYRPFTTLSYLFNYAILDNRDHPAGYHAINLILHLGNVLLAYALSLHLMRRFWPAVFTAALWCVHPVVTESVTNIVGRSDLLAATAVLSGFLLYLKSAEATGWARGVWLAGLALATLAGVFSKESAVAIFPVIVIYDLVWWKQQRHPALAYGLLATLLPIALMLYKRAAVLAVSAPAEFPFTDNPIAGADWWTGRLTAVKVIARYLWLMVWPAKLSSDYSFAQIPLARGAAEDWFGYLVVLLVTAAVVLLYRSNRTGFFLACFAFVNFVPASNLLFPIGTMMADRLLYLPALGLLACLVLAIYALSEKLKLAALPAVVLCLIVCGFAVRTWIRNLDWQTELAIATADVRVSPSSYKLHQLLAASLFEADSSHSNLKQVVEEQAKSVALLDSLPAALSRPEPYRQAGYYLLLKGDRDRELDARQSALAYQSSLLALQKGISIDQARRPQYQAGTAPQSADRFAGDPQAYLLLSLVYLRLDNPVQAFHAIDMARRLAPLNPQIYRQLSAVLARQGRDVEADLALMQENAITFLQEGRWMEAANATERVLRMDSAYPSARYLNAMANLRLGRLEAAEASARAALRLDSDRRNPTTYYVLGLILAQQGQFREAAESLNKYLKEAQNAPDSETVRKQLRDIQKTGRLR